MVLKNFATALILLSYFVYTEGVVCQVCNARTKSECKALGRHEECEVGEICSTVIRKNGPQAYMTKRCQQREACLNEQNQNWHRISGGDYACNSNGGVSICRCCCFSDICYSKQLCPAAEESKTAVSCPSLAEPFRYGSRSCSNSNKIGSVCSVSCSGGYAVNPEYSKEIRCLPNGRWDKPEPCCAKPCPPNLYVDLVYLRHYKNHERLQYVTRRYLADFLKKVNVGPDSLRLAQIHYDSQVHTPYLGFRETANLTSQEILNLSIEEAENIIINSSVANTGAALRHIHENLFNTEYDRPDARNIILHFTDSSSTDEVADAARALRKSGVTIYTYFIQTKQAEEPNLQQLYEISGFYDRRRLGSPGQVLDRLYANVCPGSCRT